MIEKVVELVTPYCGNCKMIEPTVKSMFELYKVPFEKIDASGKDGKPYVWKYDVRSVPTFIITYKESDKEPTVVDYANFNMVKQILIQNTEFKDDSSDEEGLQ